MTNSSMNDLSYLHKALEDNDPDLLRALVQHFAEALMAAEADSLCGAPYRQRSDQRVNSRNGYRTRPWDTRVGTIDLAIPKLRQGSYFPNWLLEPRRRAEQALVSVVVQSYVLGVSTRRVDRLVQSLGLAGMSKSRVSEMARELDQVVEQFRQRPLDGPYPFLWLDGLEIKCREGGRVVNVTVVLAVGVNAEGRREILGLDVITSEDGAGWLAFLRALVHRGLHGVALVISHAHAGLKEAIAKTLPGSSWQRCRTHLMANLRTKVPKAAQSAVATLVRTIFDQDNREAVRAQHRQVLEKLEDRFPQAAALLDEATEDLLAFDTFPKSLWKQIWSNNPLERLNKEIRRRTDVVGIFPDRNAILRLVGAVLAEQHDEWAITRRYMSLGALAPVLTSSTPQLPEPEEEVRLVASG